MREIRFRGKVIQSCGTDEKYIGMWIYGDLFHMGDRVCIAPINTQEEIEDMLLGNIEIDSAMLPTMEVEKESVGQATGYTTEGKNKRELWEGDKTNFGVVKWSEAEFAWQVGEQLLYEVASMVEIIGHIHTGEDNKERKTKTALISMMILWGFLLIVCGVFLWKAWPIAHTCPLPSPQKGEIVERIIEKTDLTMEDLLDAIEQEESGGDANAIGPDGEIGAYQIKKIYVDDCNRIMKLIGLTGHYAYEDRWDRDESRDMAGIVMAHYAWNDWKNKHWDMMGYLETAARTHKSSSMRNDDSTLPYWNKIKARLYERNE